MAEFTLISLPLAEITVDPAVQDRAGMAPDVVAEYAQANLDTFPPVHCWQIEDKKLLSAGHHTYEAHKKAKRRTISVKLFTGGTLADAILDAVHSNTKHGRQRTGEDKRHAVRQLLTHFPESPACWIQAEAHVGPDLVASVMDEMKGEDVKPQTHPRLYKRTKRKDGKSQPRNEEEADKQRHWIRRLIRLAPKRSDQDIADEVGCSRPTVAKQRAWLAAQPKDREPGEEEPKKRQPKNGQVLYDWKKFQQSFGAVVRGLDSAASAYKAKTSLEYRGCERLLSELLTAIKAFRKKVNS